MRYLARIEVHKCCILHKSRPRYSATLGVFREMDWDVDTSRQWLLPPPPPYILIDYVFLFRLHPILYQKNEEEKKNI